MRLKIVFLMALVLLAVTSLQAQQNALFQATLYFEDAIGNKDSVIVGYDPDATYDIDPEFGEVEITTPFDSVLEVRATSTFNVDPGLSKKIIQGTDIIIGPNCHNGPLIEILVWSKYQPVRVSWDSSLFLNEECARGTFLSNHEIDELTGPFPLHLFPPVCVCMAAASSYVFELTQEALLAHYEAIEFPGEHNAVDIEWEVEGLGVQTIYGLRFKPNDVGGYTPCYWITTHTDEPATPTAPLTIFPNPSSGPIHIAGAEATAFEQLRVFDAMGEWVRELGVHHGEADLSGLPAGIYQLQAQGGDGKRYMGRVVKL